MGEKELIASRAIVSGERMETIESPGPPESVPSETAVTLSCITGLKFHHNIIYDQGFPGTVLDEACVFLCQNCQTASDQGFLSTSLMERSRSVAESPLAERL